MISRDEILDLLKSRKSDLTAWYKVRSIGIFGSFARREGRADSDVDILVDFCEGADLFDLIQAFGISRKKDRKACGFCYPAGTSSEDT
jgi:hypothetical protein